MGRKTEVEVPYKLCEIDANGKITELSEVGKIDEAAVEADVNTQVFVYVGPTIRGVITNGGIYTGTAQEISKRFEKSIEKYPQIKRLIIADTNVARAREMLAKGEGVISVAYKNLTQSINKEV